MKYLSKPLLLLALAGGLLSVWAQAPDQSGYVGSNTCEQCHRQGYRRFAATKMARVFFGAPQNQLEAKGCDACHGPGREHVEAAREHDRARAAGIPYQGPSAGKFVLGFGKDARLSVSEQNAQCLQCHERGARLFWKGSAHEARGLACVTCHQIHQERAPALAAARFIEPLTNHASFSKPTQVQVCVECHPMRKAQLLRSSHMPVREGLMTCASCHNPHGGPNPTMLVAATVNDTCYQCHPERRGPSCGSTRR